jgi:hypothetical protein
MNNNSDYKPLTESYMVTFDNVGNSRDRYDLLYIFNKVKEIGKLAQILRIDRHNVIYGEKLLNLLIQIIGNKSLNKSLLLELSNYEWNMELINIITNRINLAPNLDNSYYPDYYLLNILRILNSVDLNNIDLGTLMHLALDIGQLEYIMDKYKMQILDECYPKIIFDLKKINN